MDSIDHVWKTKQKILQSGNFMEDLAPRKDMLRVPKAKTFAHCLLLYKLQNKARCPLYNIVPVVPHKAVAEVSKIGNL